MKRLILAAVLAAAAAGLSGCEKSVEAPADPGGCYIMTESKDHKFTFGKIADKVPDIEHCAAKLEISRIQFLRMGGSRQEIAGAFQGTFLWLQHDGIFTSQKLEGIRYPLLVRFKGELVMPGAIVDGQAAPGVRR